MSTAFKILTRGVLPVGIFVLGLGCAGVMIAARPGAESKEPSDVAQPVEVMQAQPREVAAIVSATGTVSASRQVTLSPEVSGKITFVDDRLRPGGTFQKGDTLLRVDARDYRAQLAADQARLAQSKLELALEEKRQITAEREWELLGSKGGQDSLALRKPHLEVAKANFRSAEAAVERAQLNVSRASLRAPFNAVIVSESAELGQVINAQSPQLITMVGTDAVRVSVSVPVERLSAIDIPGFNGDAGSRVRVVQERAFGPDVVHEGQVNGVSGQLDPQTRTATLVVEVADPRSGTEPLLPGSFVEVEIVGRPLADAVPIPRAALASADSVWVVIEGAMTRRPVQVGWRTDEEVYISSGLAAGELVVTTPPSLPVDGMLVTPKAAVAQQGGE